MQRMMRWLAIVFAAVSLVACGDGGGSRATAFNTGAGGNGGGGGGNGGAGGTTNAIWEVQDYTADFNSTLTQLNAQGARGYLYVSGLALVSGSTTTPPRNVYVKDSNNTFTYEILPNQSARADFLAQMNAQGARGFDFYGPTTVGTIYVKSSGSSATYNHQLLDYVATTSNFLTQVNAQGASGYFFSGNYIFSPVGGAEYVTIYTKASDSNSTFAYRLEPYQDSSTSTFVAQANTQGQQGYAFIGSNIFTDEPNAADNSRNIYVKDTTQSANFSWKVMDYRSTFDDFLAQANAEGAQGSFFTGSAVFFPNAISAPILTVNVYAKPSNCSGILCRASGGF
ncbi:MAG: hypothetical protein HC765_14565 [Brachymonas sp.]|nr:hypothetical protein [Brachymonas sp.]